MSPACGTGQGQPLRGVVGEQLCRARGAAGTEQGQGNTREKGLEQGLLGMLVWGLPGMLLQEWRRQSGRRDGRGEQHSPAAVSSISTGKNLLQCSKLGSRLSGAAGVSRDLMSHPCSPGLSQRKDAWSVPIPRTPGSKATCKSWSRTEPSRVASAAAVMNKARHAELQPWSRTLGQQELQEHLQVSPRCCWKDALYLGLLFILGLHSSGCSLIPLP